jgi:transcriptional regulator with XRE-family HTH domain
MKDIKRLFGARVRELRKSRGLNQAELAEIIGVDAKHVSRIETGNTFPYPDKLDALAGALGVQIKELFEFEHMAEENITVRNIEEMLRGAGEEKLRVIFRVIKAILR